MEILHISHSTLGIAGGLVLLLIAVKMIFSSKGALFGEDSNAEPLVFPIAVPYLAGPSALATTMLLSAKNDGYTLVLAGAILTAMLVSTLILFIGNRVLSLMGDSFCSAMQKLMGLLLTMIAVEMFMSGIHKWMATL